MIRLIVIDLDGTLLNDEKKISQENENAIRRALEMGIAVSISTGRSYVSGHEYVEQLGIDVPVSYQNGALVTFGHGEEIKVISRSVLDPSKARMIYKRATEKSLNTLVFFDFFTLPDISTVVPYDSPYREYYRHNKYRMVFEENPLKRISNDGIPEIAVEGKESLIKDLILESNSHLQNVTVVKNDSLEDHAFYEFFGPGVGKEKGLRHILDYLNLDWDSVAHIGDNYNDLEILKKVALPIVMANGPLGVKKHASFVTVRDNNSGGVAEAIERILRTRGEL
ncbi:Cof-type HAD-IIB family hydrolase [Mesotoga prima]|uniref:Cof-type HAD-IIB family hydrolase n=1 Tax=Mesotoga prima TaxID=1184387 RepID=UPI001BD359C3|nr:Cof-type HAD-IIB family hydrolase [Mesotoga prima]HNQ70929.1 Cof-type HAD-IIB family hydrolase [Mesotoga prima]